MKINISTKEPHKTNALREVISEYTFFKDVKIVIVEKSASEVSEQPKCLEEITSGAKNRTTNTFEDCDLSIGLEQGLMLIPNTERYFDVCVCVIYDGKDFYSGISSGFEHPQKVLNKVFKDNITIGQAYDRLGIIDKYPFKYKKGTIGLLSNGKFSRKDTIRQSIEMAIISLVSEEFKD